MGSGGGGGGDDGGGLKGENWVVGGVDGEPMTD
jgi:hypothetical protein